MKKNVFENHQINKPLNDKRVYKCFTLENDLQVMIVKDDESEMVKKNFLRATLSNTYFLEFSQ